ncbi:MAG: hypothetical protein KF780_13075 [Sphingomonas sp.]|nr:hypothetical protein [Sphingomonas sp.]
MTLCLLTPEASYPLGEAEWRTQAEALAALFGARGVEVVLAPWSSDDDLARHALVVPLMAWGYHRRLDHWYAQLDRWVAAGVRLINPPDVLRWNSDKAYLLDFEAKGVAIIPSLIAETADAAALDEARSRFVTERLVVKPVSSAGSDGTYLLGPGDALPGDVAGRRMLVQPMMPAIAQEGELSLFHLGGRYSHAIVKRPKTGEFRVQPQFGGSFTEIDPAPAARRLADAALAAAGPDIAYARIDMVSDRAGGYRLMEIELIEPYLFLERAPDGGRGFVEMVLGNMSVVGA